MPYRWQFVASCLSIFTGMEAGQRVEAWNGAGEVWTIVAVVLAVYGLVYLQWRAQLHRGHGAQ